MITIGVIMGSTRPGRKADAVARWVHDIAAKRADATVELVDLAEYRLPHLDEPLPPSMGRYTQPHTRTWAARIAALDAFVFVTPEYNHSAPAVLKNAIDFLHQEWVDKAAGFVSYGTTGGTSAVEHLRLVLGQVGVATVRSQVALSLFTDFVNFTSFQPGAHHEGTLGTMLDQVVAWGSALRPLRRP